MNNTKHTVTSILDGTKTAENLRLAFEKEAINFAKGYIYSDFADENGDMTAKRILNEQADNDRRLAELWLSYLDENGTTAENLYALSQIKQDLAESFYPAMADIADSENLGEIAEKLRLASNAKLNHTDILMKEHDKLLSSKEDYYSDSETPWLCSACGYVVKGNTPPERCPLCSYPSSYFEKM